MKAPKKPTDLCVSVHFCLSLSSLCVCMCLCVCAHVCMSWRYKVYSSTCIFFFYTLPTVELANSLSLSLYLLIRLLHFTMSLFVVVV